MSDIRLWTMDRLLYAYSTSETSPDEAVSECLAVLDEWEPDLNAFITVYRSARAQPGNGLLQGVPIALKDLVDVAGEHTTSGSRILKDYVSPESAAVWTQLKSAGAVLLGKTNMLEFAYGVPHPDYGQTNNPYDVKRTSGGSSGGSAAAVAVGAVFGAIGTDTGGSIRIPAAYCGVVGLKPTYGTVSPRGVFPLSGSLDHVGPLTRSARDAALMMEVIQSGEQSSSPERAFRQRNGFLAAMNRPSGFKRVGYLSDEFLTYTHPDMKTAYLNALATLSNQGVKLIPLSAESVLELTRSEEVLMKILLAEASQVHRPWWHLADDYAKTTWKQIEEGQKVLATDYLQALADQHLARQTVASWFQEFDALATPTVDFPAPLEDPVIGDVTMNEMRYTGPFNLTGNPAVTVPCGMSTEGLPLGLQLVGALFDDAKLLRFAHEFELSHPPIPRPHRPCQ